jgi:hypothetical protein
MLPFLQVPGSIADDEPQRTAAAIRIISNRYADRWGYSRLYADRTDEVRGCPLHDGHYHCHGCGAVRPLDHAGLIFTIALIFTGVGTAYYAFAALTEMIVGGQLREILNRGAMTRKIHQLENHAVICGYGRFGRVVADELRRQGATLVVIENDPSKENALLQAGLLYIMGSALEESTLDQAAIA